MRIAVVLVALLAAAGFCCLTAWALGRARSAGPGLALLLVGALAWVALAARNSPGEAAVLGRPIQTSANGYVSSRTCRTCHAANYASWRASYHRSMTQVVSPESVVANFDDVDLEWSERRYHLERRGKEFWVRIGSSNGDGAGVTSERRVVLSTGSHHAQLYWLAAEQGRRLEILPFHYLIPERRWIPRASFFVNPPGADGESGDWNAVCVQCHASGPRPRVESERADTEVGEFGIACEACHGPGARHVELQRNPLRRYASHWGLVRDDSIIDPADLDKRRASEVCGQCHGYWEVATPDVAREANLDGFEYRPGGDLAVSKRMVHRARFRGVRPGTGMDFLVHGMWWPDGTVRGSGREFGALQRSPCYLRGEMSCLSCHSLHQDADDPRDAREWADDQLQPGMRGDAACLQCHGSFAGRIEEHTHHPAASEGSRCQNCHMSYTTYGLLKAIRSHQIDSPRIGAGGRSERPNACNQCHLDRTLAWTAGHLEGWYGMAAPQIGPEESSVAASILWLLRGDAGQRVIAAWSMGWEPAREASGEEWMAPYLAELLDDSYHPIRFVAQRSLLRLEGFGSLEHDFIGPEAQRQATRRAVLETWERLDGGAKRAGDAALLIDGEGELRRDRVAELLEERDQRPIFIVE